MENEQLRCDKKKTILKTQSHEQNYKIPSETRNFLTAIYLT